ncbi:hypothetical protein ACF0H5_001085 [Mactra antiquata]
MNKLKSNSKRVYRVTSKSAEVTRLNHDTIESKYHFTVAMNGADTDADMKSTRMTFEVSQDDPESDECNLKKVKAWTDGKILSFIVLIGYLVYLGFAIYLNPEDCAFVVCLGVLIIYVCVNIITRNVLKRFLVLFIKRLRRCLKPKNRRIVKWSRWVTTILALSGIIVFLVIDLWNKWTKWIPASGLAILIFISVLFSKHRRKIYWVPVVWGFIMQFALGLLILRWETGYKACKWVGDQITTFLAYTDAGSSFVFGEKYTDHPIIFQILPVVIFFSAVISVLYYIGAMQAIIKSIAIVLQVTLNTTPIESFATAAHIFIGQVESSVALRPFWNKLTESELHAIMTSGFATVAGTVIAAYIGFGVPAEHVISASFMSAPAALAIAKISIPETQPSKIKTQKEIKIPTGQETNLIESLSVGATIAIKLISYIVVNLIAFVSVLSFLDTSLSYFGSRVNYPELNFQLICSYIFMPLAAVMGVPWSDTKLVGALIGKKIVINEFLAYIDLGKLIDEGSITDRSIVLGTYILCGFGSIAAIGINLGCLASAAPDRRSDFARLSLRSMINGNIACFMTACVAGLLYQTPESIVEVIPTINGTLENTTSTLNMTLNTTTSENLLSTVT